MDKKLYNSYDNNIRKFADDFFKVPDINNFGKFKKVVPHLHQYKILENSGNLLIKKTRQVGTTQALAHQIAYNLNYKKYYRMVVVLHNLPMVSIFRNYILNHFNNIPNNIKYQLQIHTKTKIECLDTNSTVTLMGNPSANTFRSYSFDAIYAEEVDYIKNFPNIFNIMSQMMLSNGRMVLTTTPNGGNNKFAELWNTSAVFNKLNINDSTSSYNKASKNTNDVISKAQYDEIIDNCVLL